MRGLLIALLALSACQLPLGRGGTPGTGARQAPASSPVETLDLVRAERAVRDGSDTGVGSARDARGDWYIVQLFVRRR